MLTKQSREDLKWAMKATLLEQAIKIQVKEARMFVKNFILKEATYEQLLNLALNPHRDERYLEAEKLEQVAKVTVQESLEGKSAKKSKALLESFVKEMDGAPVASVLPEPKKVVAAATDPGMSTPAKIGVGVGAGVAAATALGGYLVYRKMRSEGKSKQEAAQAAAAAETNPDKKQMWLTKSQEWAGQ